MTPASVHRWAAGISHETSGAPRLIVNVVGTSERETSTALEAASALARDLDADIRILLFRVVPYPLDLDQPDVAPSFTMARWNTLTQKLRVAVHFHIYYCRDMVAALEEALAPRSLVLVGKRKKRWWRGRDSRQTRLLRSRGHDLVVVEVR